MNVKSRKRISNSCERSGFSPERNLDRLRRIRETSRHCINYYTESKQSNPQNNSREIRYLESRQERDLGIDKAAEKYISRNIHSVHATDRRIKQTETIIEKASLLQDKNTDLSKIEDICEGRRHPAKRRRLERDLTPTLETANADSGQTETEHSFEDEDRTVAPYTRFMSGITTPVWPVWNSLVDLDSDDDMDLTVSMYRQIYILGETRMSRHERHTWSDDAGSDDGKL